MAELKGIIEADLSRVQAEMSVLESKRELLLWKIDYLKKLLSSSESTEGNRVVSTPHERDERFARKLHTTVVNVVEKITAIEAIHSVLKKHGKAMKISEITQHAIDDGYDSSNVGFEKTKANFSSVLSRAIGSDPNTPFRREPRARVGLKSWPEPKDDE